MIDLGQVVKAIGPNASIVFAAWIFMGFLQQRYDSALDRYRAAISDYRSNDLGPERTANVRDQVLVFFRQRCRLMGSATLVGMVSAILLILTLIIGGIDAIVPHVAMIAIAESATALVGFLLVIVAAAIVMVEGRIVHRQLDTELLDVPDPADRVMKDHAPPCGRAN